MGIDWMPHAPPSCCSSSVLSVAKRKHGHRVAIQHGADVVRVELDRMALQDRFLAFATFGFVADAFSGYAIGGIAGGAGERGRRHGGEPAWGLGI